MLFNFFSFINYNFVFQYEAEQVVSQTDIVPTLSLLLGIPIPFSNLGIIMPSLFENSGLQNVPENLSRLHAFQLNAKQVNRYITEYTKISSDISARALETITNHLFPRQVNISRDKNKHFSDNTRNYNGVFSDENLYLTYLRQIRELCRKVWAKFDISAIQSGIFTTAVACLLSLAWILSPQLSSDLQNCKEIYECGILALLAALFPGVLLFYGQVWVFLLALFVLGITVYLRKLHTNIIGFTKENVARIRSKEIIILFLLFVQFAGFFSNSYVINEDKILLFFLQTTIVVSAVNILTNSTFTAKVLEQENSKGFRAQNRKDKKKRSFALTVFWEIRQELACLLFLMVLFRSGSLFWPCREEQVSCEATKLFVSGQNGYQFLVAAMFLLVVPASLIFRLRANDNLKGYSGPVLAVKYALPFGAVFACVHWLLQYIPAKMLDQNPALGLLQQIIAPSILYCCCLVTICCLLYQPISTFVIRPRDLENEPAISAGQWSRRDIVRIFKRLRSELSETDSNKNIPYVYGLGTVYSSAVIILLVCFALPVTLVLGDGLGPSVTFMMAQMYLFLEFDRLVPSPEADDAQMSVGM